MTLYSRRELAVLMVSTGIGVAALSSRVAAAQGEDSEGHGAVVNGMSIYLGILPSDIIAKGYGKNTPEYKMHHEPPKGLHFHHVMVAIYQQNSGQRIMNAVVTATVRGVGEAGQTKKMEPFDVAGAMTYCNYFNMLQYGKYRIELEITRPGDTSPTKAELIYDHTRDN